MSPSYVLSSDDGERTYGRLHNAGLFTIGCVHERQSKDYKNFLRLSTSTPAAASVIITATIGSDEPVDGVSPFSSSPVVRVLSCTVTIVGTTIS